MEHASLGSGLPDPLSSANELALAPLASGANGGDTPAPV